MSKRPAKSSSSRQPKRALGLGRGLDALLGGGSSSGSEASGDSGSFNSEGLVVSEPTSFSSVSSGFGGGLLKVPLNSLAANPNQPRKEFAAESLTELANSIKEKGILQPILVEADGNSYIIIAGERRWRAAGMAGLKEIPVIVRTYTEQEKLEIALIENIQRDDLTPLEEALAYKQLMETARLGQEELAGRLGKNRSTVANALRLLKLPEEIRESLTRREITPGHARALLSVVNPSDMKILFAKIVDKGLSVREAETLAAGLNTGSRAAAPPPKKAAAAKHGQAELRDMEEKLLDIFGTKVRITGDGKKGTIEISYFSLDDLNRVYEIITGS